MDYGFVRIKRKSGLEPETQRYFLLNPSATIAQLLAIDTNIRTIKYGAGITLASVTANRSDVAGTAFITNPTFTATGLPSNDLRWLVGFKLTFADGGVGWAKAVGNGETYLDIIGGTNPALLNGNFSAGDPPTGWTPTRGTPASETGAGNFNTSPSMKLTVTPGQATGNTYRTLSGDYSNKLMRLSAYLKNGDATNVYFKIDGNVTPNLLKTANITSTTIAQYTKYGTILAVDNTALYVYAPFVTGDGKIGYADDVVLQQVLTPSALGLTTVSTQGGATYNWASVGTTPNTWPQNITVTRN